MKNSLHREITREAAVCGRMKPKQVVCPQCGSPTDRFYEGYCKACRDDNQRALGDIQPTKQEARD